MQAFATWQWHAQHAREKKAGLSRALQLFRNRTLAAAFRGMRTQCSLKRHLRGMATHAIAHWKGSVTVAAFFAWADWTRDKKETKGKVVAHDQHALQRAMDLSAR